MTQLNGQFIDVPIFNQLVPNEGPKAIRIVCDFSTTDTYNVDVTVAQESGIMRAVQTLYIDTSEADQPIVLYSPRTGQRITVLPDRQGYFPFLIPNPPIFDVTSQASVGSIATIIMLNVPMPAQWWPTV